jgi:hypothetical protein
MKVKMSRVRKFGDGTPNRRRWLLSLTTIAVLGLAMGSSGCNDDDDDVVDVTPPAIPAGVSSITADEEIILYWIPNREPDLEGYRIWWSADNNSFEELDDIDAFDPDYYDAGTGEGDDYMLYFDFGIANRSENFYAVTAYDLAGNESDLSLEYVRDVPRPEGDVVLQRTTLAPMESGFDFSRAPIDPSPQDYLLVSTDVWYEVDGGGVPWLVVAAPSTQREIRVQDYGLVGFDGLSIAPASGYSRRDRVEVIAGHCYAFEIVTDPGGLGLLNYAKLYIKSVSANEVSMRWGYQEISGEPQLKHDPDGPRLPQSRALQWIKRKADQS